MVKEQASGSNSRQHDSIFRFQLQVFAFMWAAATLFHQVQFKTIDSKFHYFILTIAAISVLIKPSSFIRFFIFVFLQLNVALIQMPEISNHWALVTIVNLTIVQVLIFSALKEKSVTVNSSSFFARLIPIVRAEIIIFYFYVVFHKLNSAFLNPDVSCASEFLTAQNIFPITPSRFLLQSNAYLTLVIEAIIPVFLLFRKTRTAGLLIGLIFHCIIAFNPLNGFYDFSSSIFALYVFFLPTAFVQSLHLQFQSLFTNDLKQKTLGLFGNRAGKSFLFQLFFTSCIVLGCLLAINLAGYLVSDFYRYIVWALYSLFAIVVFAKWAFSSNTDEVVIKPQPFHWSFYLFPVITLLNGFSPYLGLKTEYSFAMFSNLRTEGGLSNHYLVSSGWQLFDYQKDMIEIKSSSDPTLQAIADKKQLLTYFKLKEAVSKRKIETIEYIRNGELISYDAISGKNHDLKKRNSFLERKFLDFRTIYKQEPQPCSH